MCGRIIQYHKKEEVLEEFGAYTEMEQWPVSYNLCPTQNIRFIAKNRENKNQALVGFWKLLREWNKSRYDNVQTINCRASELMQKTTYKSAFEKGYYAVVPASLYAEWITVGKQKVPVLFQEKHLNLLAMAALYYPWVDTRTGETLITLSILTTEPREDIAAIHDRMPVLLNKEQTDFWLDRNNRNFEEKKKLFEPNRQINLDFFAVDASFNYTPRHADKYQNSEEIIRPTKNKKEVLDMVKRAQENQLGLF